MPGCTDTTGLDPAFLTQQHEMLMTIHANRLHSRCALLPLLLASFSVGKAFCLRFCCHLVTLLAAPLQAVPCFQDGELVY